MSFVVCCQDGKVVVGEVVARASGRVTIRPVDELGTVQFAVGACVVFDDRATAEKYREAIVCEG